MTMADLRGLVLLIPAVALLASAGRPVHYQGHVVSSPTSWYNVWFSTPERLQTVIFPEVQPRALASHSSRFGYTEYNGPENWALDFPTCAGYRQSPIDLDTAAMLRLLVADEMNWDGYWRQPKNMTLINTGHTIQLSATWAPGTTPSVTGGPLEGEYVFSQLHFHWGSEDDFGSEHTVHNVSFPLEMHVVHYKRDYGSLEAAQQFQDGLMVTAHLFRISEQPNLALDEVMESLNAVKGPELRVAVDPFHIENLHVPFERDYVTYSGSLTTPPCSEAVTWIISARPLPVAPHQLDQLRQLNGMDGELEDNFRPIQPRNGRPVFYVS